MNLSNNIDYSREVNSWKNKIKISHCPKWPKIKIKTRRRKNSKSNGTPNGTANDISYEKLIWKPTDKPWDKPTVKNGP